MVQDDLDGIGKKKTEVVTGSENQRPRGEIPAGDGWIEK
jgi:hypothetical protein